MKQNSKWVWVSNPLAKLKMGWILECPAKLKMDPKPSKTQNERTSKNTENPLQKPKQEQYKSTGMLTLFVTMRVGTTLLAALQK
jgi:hypothetical protein